MSNELISATPLGPTQEEDFLNADSSRATWITRPSLDDRRKALFKRSGIGLGITTLLWAIQYSNGTLKDNWQFPLWCLGIGVVLGLMMYSRTEIRHYSTHFIAHTHQQRFLRASKWWACALLVVSLSGLLQYSTDALRDHWQILPYLGLIGLPGFYVYFARGERVLTPAATKAKLHFETAPTGPQPPSAFEKAIEKLIELTWVRYPLSIGCFYLAYYLASETKGTVWKYGLLSTAAFLVGAYFAREVSKWLLGAAVLALVIWAIFAGLSALSIPAAIIIGAIIIANSSKK